MKVAKEEQAFWDAVFLLWMKDQLASAGLRPDSVRISENAAMCADVALAARRARSQ